METTIDVRPQVAAGVAFLDEHDPDWFRPDAPNAIDLDRFDLGDPDICVLGQRCPREVLAEYQKSGGCRFAGLYRAYRNHLSGLTMGEADDWAERHGFSAGLGSDAEYDALTDAWRETIEQRRAAL